MAAVIPDTALNKSYYFIGTIFNRGWCMNKILFGFCAAALAVSAFATIQPTRVGPVSQYGALQAGKNSDGEGRIYGSVDGVVDGKEVQVKGMSLTWSMYWPYGSSFYGQSFIDTLVGGWNVELVRSAMGVVPPWGHGSYMTRPEYFSAQMDTVVQAAIKNDVYVLIDWHSEGGYYNCIHADAPKTKPFNDNKACFSAADAAKFFEKMAERYGKYPHVIFEIYNEPVSENWDELKAYADTVTAAIRKYSDNLIVVGTPTWSSEAGKAAANPMSDKNTAYTYHFYADLHTTAAHTKSSNEAMASGLAVMVTEWGGIDKIFENATHKAQLEEFLAWTTEKKLSYAKWDVEKPFLEDNDVDNYIKANILPAKTTYAKNLSWETTIVDALPNMVKYSMSDMSGEWSSFSDKTGYPDPDGDLGATTYDESDEGSVHKIENVNLDTAGTGFDYAPHVRVDYTFDGNLNKCKMVAYKYKGANHQFQAFGDWNLTEEIWGEGAWDFPYVEMPYSPEWTTAVVDFGWMVNNGWQTTLPTDKVDLQVVTSLRYELTGEIFEKNLWIDSVRCVTAVEGYDVVGPEGITPTVRKNTVANFSVNGNVVTVTGLKAGMECTLMNLLGQKIASGRAATSSLNITVPVSGRYMLNVGGKTGVVTIK